MHEKELKGGFILIFDLEMRDVEFYSQDNTQYNSVKSELEKLNGLAYQLKRRESNSRQLDSTFDNSVINWLSAKKHNKIMLEVDGCSKDIRNDFCFDIFGKTTVFEVEKSNKEKILYDLLKFHVYLSCKADLTVLMVPKNWVHKLGTENLFAFAKEKLILCETYGMINRDYSSSILIMGFNQYFNGSILNKDILLQMKQ